ETIEIRLDPALSVVENAQQYYDRARRSRASRQSAADRIESARADVEAMQRMASELEAVVDIDGLRAFKKSHAHVFLGSRGGTESSSRPFRRYSVGDGFEVWVGRNAKENDELTFSHARKFDIWMHARGVAGSHTVLRLPGRGVKPGPAILEKAASVAAYFSKARGSELVPVMYTERKYVRKPRGADGGKVIVEREEVVIVRPALPIP
ncbi:MAG: NFACT RNA binding domain-containing protein, partial [Rhodothermales bacterium]|nr:NFACT RNA binding domain-containing protein [Rhodothermales bacterium]